MHVAAATMKEAEALTAYVRAQLEESGASMTDYTITAIVMTPALSARPVSYAFYTPRSGNGQCSTRMGDIPGTPWGVAMPEGRPARL